MIRTWYDFHIMTGKTSLLKTYHCFSLKKKHDPRHSTNFSAWHNWYDLLNSWLIRSPQLVRLPSMSYSGLTLSFRVVMSIFNRFFDDRLNSVSKDRFSKVRFRLIDHTEIKKSILNSSQTFLYKIQFWTTFVWHFFWNNVYFWQCWALNWM